MARVSFGRCVVACCAVVAGAMAQAAAALAQQPVVFYGLTFPATIAGAQIGEPRDFESQTPGLGYSVKYNAPGWAIDVYVYDMKLATIPADPTSEPVMGQLRQASSDVLNRPNAAGVKVRLRYAVMDHNIRTRLLCTSFSYSDGDAPVDSYLCVTSWNNKFVKFRLTTRSRPGSDAAANEFMKAWIPVLWIY